MSIHGNLRVMNLKMKFLGVSLIFTMIYRVKEGGFFIFIFILTDTDIVFTIRRQHRRPRYAPFQVSVH